MVIKKYIKKYMVMIFENYNPLVYDIGDKTKEIESPAVSHVFQNFSSVAVLTSQGPKDGTLQLIPIAKSIAYVLTRALLSDVPEQELCGSNQARALSINLITILYFLSISFCHCYATQDMVWWQLDVIHAVEDMRFGKGYSNVVYVGSTPYCKKFDLLT